METEHLTKGPAPAAKTEASQDNRPAFSPMGALIQRKMRARLAKRAASTSAGLEKKSDGSDGACCADCGPGVANKSGDAATTATGKSQEGADVSRGGPTPYAAALVEIVDEGDVASAGDHTPAASTKPTAATPPADASSHHAQAGENAPTAVAKQQVTASVEQVAPSLSIDEGHGALAKASSSTKSGAAASNALGPGDYGLTFPESVGVKITAVKRGANWSPKVKSMVGHYSLQTRLLPGQSEVTGPGGNTTAGNFCDQVTGLTTLGNTAGNTWYMIQAVKKHEHEHEKHFSPALKAVVVAISASIEAVTIADAPGMNASTAATALKADGGFAAAVSGAQATWLAQILTLAAGDHAAGGPTDTAEHKVVDPMVKSICKHAKKKAWPACPACP